MLSYRTKGIKTDYYLDYEFTENGKKVINQSKPKENTEKIYMVPEEEKKLKYEYDKIFNKTKNMMIKCNYTRKKHFKSQTLRLG